MYQYFILQSKKNLKNEKDMLISLFNEVVNIEHLEIDNNQIVVIFSELLESSLRELSQIISEEFFIEIRIYKSKRFETLSHLERNLKKTKKLLLTIPFNPNTTYLNANDLLYFEITESLDVNYKHKILKKYYHDNEMKNILKVYFESNQNTTEAAKKLYLHRNTLIQRLDKFYEETGYNPRRFKDAVIIYRAIEN